VTVNSYAPGAIDTNMSACSVCDLTHLTHTNFSVANPLDKEHSVGFGIKQVSLINESLAVLVLILRQLLKLGDVRIGTPADVANLASFLASPESHFITGE
jgi:NAD(P)-dependent dehydrogenase (short-subunit alcohol dehydrogenase family)